MRHEFKYTNETVFKDDLQKEFWAKKVLHRRELYVGTLENTCGTNYGVSGFADFASHKGKWFIECKLKVSAAEISRGLGQCLFYREFLDGYQGFLVYPEEGSKGFETDSLEALCDRYGVILTTNTNIVRDLRRWMNGKKPFRIALSEQLKEKTDIDGWGKVIDDFYAAESEEPEPLIEITPTERFYRKENDIPRHERGRSIYEVVQAAANEVGV